MDPTGPFFINNHYEGVPMYSPNGRAYTPAERAAIAKKRGQCISCGVKTHAKGALLRKTPITDDNAYQGICIRCAPESVPPHIVAAWDQRNKPVPFVNAKQHHATATAKSAAAAVGTAATAASTNPDQKYLQPNNTAGSHQGQQQGVATTSGSNQGSSRSVTRNPSAEVVTAAASVPATQSTSLTRKTSGIRRRPSMGADQPSISSRNPRSSSSLNNGKIGSQRDSFSSSIGRRPSAGSAHTPPSDVNQQPSHRKVSPNSRRQMESHADPLTVAMAKKAALASAPASRQNPTKSAAKHPTPSASTHYHGMGHVRLNEAPVDGVGVDRGMAQSSSSSLPLLNSSTPTTETPATSSNSKGLSKLPQGIINSSRVRSDEAVAGVRHDESYGDYSTMTVASNVRLEDFAASDISVTEPNELSQLLQEHRGDAHFVRQILHQIRNCLDDCSSLLVHELKDTMNVHRLDPRVMAVGSGAAWKLSAQDTVNGTESDCGCKHEIVGSALLNLLMDTLRKSSSSNISEDINPDLVEWVLGTMASVSYLPDNKQWIAKAGGIELVLESLKRHQNCSEILEWACRCLHNLVYAFDGDNEFSSIDLMSEIQKNIATIEENGGLPIIVDAMKLHPNEPVAQWWSMKLLWCLQSRSDDIGAARTKRKLCHYDFLAHSVRVLRARSTSGDLFYITCRLISSVLLAAGDDDARFYEAAAEGTPSVVRFMNDSKDPLVQEAGCELMATLCTAKDDPRGAIRRSIKESHAPLALISAVENFSDNIVLVEFGAWALWNLSNDASYFTGSLIKTGLTVLSSVADDNEDSLEILLSACGFVANASLISGTSEADIPIGLCIYALELPSEDATVCECAVRGLANICSRFPSAKKELIDGLSVPRVVDVLRDSDMAIAEHLCAVLVGLSFESDGFRKSLVTEGILAVTAVLLLEIDEPTTISSVLELVSVLVPGTGNQDRVTPPHELIDALVGILTSSSYAPSIREKVCRCVRNLVVDSASQVETSGVLDCLVSAIQNAEDELILGAAEAVWGLTARAPELSIDQLEFVFKAIVGAMERYNADGAPFHGTILAALSGTLANVMLLAGNYPMQPQLEDIDCIFACAYKVIQNDDEALALLGDLLDVMHCLCRVAEDSMIQSGVIVVVIDVMAEHESCASIQEKGCNSLASLSSSGNLQVNLSIVQTDGIEVLVCALSNFPSNAAINAQACRALGHLSEDHESRMLIIAEGGIHLAANVLVSHIDNEEVLDSACTFLFSLTSDSDSGNEHFPGEEAMIDALVATMKKHPHAIGLHDKCSRILEHIAVGNTVASRMIVQHGCIEPLVAATLEFIDKASILEHIFALFHGLAAIPENRVLIINASGIEAIVNGMLESIDYEKVQKEGCRCVAALSSTGSCTPLIISAGGIDAISFAMRAHYSSLSLQTSACKAISSLAMNAKSLNQRFACDELVQGIVSAMRRFAKSEGFQVNACKAMSNLASSLSGMDAIGRNDDVRKVVSDAAAMYPGYCAEIARQVLSLL